jgi:hypothetical protein
MAVVSLPSPAASLAAREGFAGCEDNGSTIDADHNLPVFSSEADQEPNPRASRP